MKQRKNKISLRKDLPNLRDIFLVQESSKKSLYFFKIFQRKNLKNQRKKIKKTKTFFQKSI